jgi:hypothetical protein
MIYLTGFAVKGLFFFIEFKAGLIIVSPPVPYSQPKPPLTVEFF